MVAKWVGIVGVPTQVTTTATWPQAEQKSPIDLSLRAARVAYRAAVVAVEVGEGRKCGVLKPRNATLVPIANQ